MCFLCVYKERSFNENLIMVHFAGFILAAGIVGPAFIPLNLAAFAAVSFVWYYN